MYELWLSLCVEYWYLVMDNLCTEALMHGLVSKVVRDDQLELEVCLHITVM